MDKAEYLYITGKLPEWAYYQLNGNNAQENYIKQKTLITRRDDLIEKQIKDDV